MKFSIFAISAILTGLASAQSIADIPTCAQSCIIGGIPNSCNLQPKCICESSDFLNSISCCVYDACDADQRAAVISYAKSICTPAGVTNLPDAVTCSTVSSSGSAAATASSSSGTASSTETSSSASTSGTAASVSSMMSSATSAAASAATQSSSGLAAMATPVMGAVGAAVMGIAALL